MESVEDIRALIQGVKDELARLKPREETLKQREATR